MPDSGSSFPSSCLCEAITSPSPSLVYFANMAPSKKNDSGSKTRSSSSAVSLQKVKGVNFYRDAKQVGRLKMLSGGKAVRDKDGKIIQAAAFQKGEDETKPGRVQPDRRWFGACMEIIYISLITELVD